MSAAPSLANTRLNIASLREQSRRELADLIQGRRTLLVVDPRLAGPLTLIADSAQISKNRFTQQPQLREWGVEKTTYLTRGPLNVSPEVRSVLYILRPSVEWMRVVAEHVREAVAGGSTREVGRVREHTVALVPRRTLVCERVLEEAGVLADVRLTEVRLQLFPLEDDLLSLELDTVFRECAVDGDRTGLFYVARALSRLQTVFGPVPTIRGIGPNAKHVRDLLQRLRREAAADVAASSSGASPLVGGEIDLLVLVDRESDLITPMCTQLTYEGLVDELFGIAHNHVDLDAELLGEAGREAQAASGGTRKKVRVLLNGNDKVYAELRDLNLVALQGTLKRRARVLEEFYNKRKALSSISDIRDYAKGIASYQAEVTALSVHTSLAQQLVKLTQAAEFHKKLEAEQSLLAGTDTDQATLYLDDCIARKEPLLRVLRLLCLMALTQEGGCLRARQHESLKRDLVQAYGYEVLFALQALERAGLFRREGDQGPAAQSRGPSFPFLRRALDLIPDSLDEQNPNDIAYVYSGYAPLSVRFVQQSLRASSWAQLMRVHPHAFEDHPLQAPAAVPTAPAAPAAPAGPSPLVHILQPASSILSSAATAITPTVSITATPASLPAPQPSAKNQVALVVYIGGITFTEISAIRFLSQMMPGYDLIICTTKVINGDTFLQSIILEELNQFRSVHLFSGGQSQGSPASPRIPLLLHSLEFISGKQQWPELVGKDGNEAAATIKRDNPSITRVDVLPEGSFVTMDYCTNRVRVYVNSSGKVSSIPRVG